MNRRTLLFSLAVSVATPALAVMQPEPGEPREIVARVYALASGANGKYEGPSGIDNRIVRAHFLSKSLDALIRKAYARSKRLNEPVIDFDPVLNTQETPEVKGLDFVVESSGQDKATVAAKFESYGAKTIVRYDFVREGGAWKIFDLRGGEGKDAWSLRKIAAGT